MILLYDSTLSSIDPPADPPGDPPIDRRPTRRPAQRAPPRPPHSYRHLTGVRYYYILLLSSISLVCRWVVRWVVAGWVAKVGRRRTARRATWNKPTDIHSHGKVLN